MKENVKRYLEVSRDYSNVHETDHMSEKWDILDELWKTFDIDDVKYIRSYLDSIRTIDEYGQFKLQWPDLIE